jgi:hypothetical protein
MALELKYEFAQTVLNKAPTKRMLVYGVTESSSKLNISDSINLIASTNLFSTNSLRNHANITISFF